MAVVKFSKQTIEPNPLEVDYWVDITSDPYGSVWKYYNGIDWVSLNLNDGSDDGLSSFDYYTKEQVNSLLSGKADVDSVESKVDDAEFANVIQNIEFREIGDNQMEMVLLKYDNATVGVTIPMASETNPGMLSGESFRDFVKQSQLQSLYDELYQIMSDLSLAEKERNDAEQLRNTNENERIAAETNRFNAESTRQFEEANRVTNENNRVTAEDNRNTAEQLRIQAEGNRASTFNTLEGEMQNIIQEGETANSLSEQATQRANEAAEIIETWESTVVSSIEEGEVTDLEPNVIANAILKTPQVLTKAEMKQARTNIDAASMDDYDSFKDTITNQVNNYRPIEINGDVTNAADEEDLTSDNGLLKLKNRNNLNGMGYVVLRKNKTFAEQVTLQNTIYEIRYDSDLNDAIVTIPEGCILKFNGGKLRNGSILCNDTYIHGLAGCFENLHVKGSVANTISLSWFGIWGTNKSNALNFSNLVNNDIKSYLLDSSVTFDNSIAIPRNVSINGNYNVLKFEGADGIGCVYISEKCELNNITIENIDNNFSGYILVADNTVTGVHTFTLGNVNLTNKYNSLHEYQCNGLLIRASNDGVSSDGAAYITGCRLFGLRATWLKIGVNIECVNLEKNDSSNFAWLNEVYMDNIYISSTEAGIKTLFEDNGVSNKSRSVGPIYIKSYECQGLKEDCVGFIHDGKWNLVVNTGKVYDIQYKGSIVNEGRVISRDFFGGRVSDSVDSDSGLKVIDSVKVYDDSTYIKDAFIQKTADTYRMSSFGLTTGSEVWKVGCEGDAYSLSSGGFTKSEHITSSQNNSTSFEHSGMIMFESRKKNAKGSGAQWMRYAKNYGQNANEILFDYYRVNDSGFFDSNLALLENYGNTEIYRFKSGISALPIGTHVKGRIKLLFKVGDNVATFTSWQSAYYNRIRNYNLSSTKLSATTLTITLSCFIIVGSDLYIDFEGVSNSSSGNIFFTFGINYERTYGNELQSEQKDGLISLNIINQHFLYGASITSFSSYNIIGSTEERPISPSVGLQYFDSTIKKPIWWTGSAWVDATGATV